MPLEIELLCDPTFFYCVFYFIGRSLGERQSFSSKRSTELIKCQKSGVGAGPGEILQVMESFEPRGKPPV